MTHAHPNRRPTRLPTPAGSGTRPAFTLVELMISIALVVLLMLGVNTVFQATSQAVGAGEAINAALRDGRAMQATLANDFAGVVPNGTGQANAPFLCIRSQAQAAYGDAKDQASSASSNPLQADLAGTGRPGDPTVPGDVITPCTYNFRNHRVDTLGMFCRGSYQRQTGNDGTFVADMTAPEAYVWYGHARLPTNDLPANTGQPKPTFVDPGAGSAGSNPNNVYAAQFTLSRFALLLRQPVPGPTGPQLYDNAGAVQAYIQDNSAGSWIPPMSATASFVNGSLVQNFTLPAYSRLDVAGTTINTLRTNLRSYITANGESGWWTAPIGMAASGGTPARFQVDPFVAKPLTSAATAQAAPALLRGCSQFTVEYAGDFLTQVNDVTQTGTYGNVTAAKPDGVLDYTMVRPPGGGTDQTTWVRQVKWYGLPRNTSGLTTQVGGAVVPSAAVANGDVVPLNDWIASSTAGLTNPYTFERVVPPYVPDHNGDAASSLVYTCAFGPNDPSPKLIRITITVLDPTGRLPDGQTYQYVFPVPPQ